MFRVVLASVLIATTGANRVRVVDKSESKTKFGATCEEMQARFHNRVAAFQTSLDELPDGDSIGRLTQARFMLRLHGVFRTIRRARDCSWVKENEGDDFDQVRSITLRLLAGNPCADVARDELHAGLSVSAETEAQQLMYITRAASALMSDTCDPTEMPEPEQSTNNNADADLIEAEDTLRDEIEGVEDGESSFIQTNSGARSLSDFLKRVGVAFLMIFLILACAAATVAIVFLLSLGVALLLAQFSMAWAQAGWVVPLLSVYPSVPFGLVGCSYGMFRLFLSASDSPQIPPASQ